MVEWQSIAFQVINGLVWSLLVALIALGLSAMFGLLGVLNMAHGALYGAGAMLGWYATQLLGNFWLGLILVPPLLVAISLPIHKLVIQRLVGKELMIGMLATSGLLLIINDFAVVTFGGAPRTISMPVSGAVNLFGFGYPMYRVVAAAIAACVLFSFWLFLRLTRLGLWIRCANQSPSLALTSGVPVTKVHLIVVCLGVYFAALAGVLAAPMTSVHYQMGFLVLGTAFVVIVIGGLGSLLGAVVAAMIIGVVRGVLTVFIDPTYADAVAIAILLPLLIIRPQGLFGERA